MMFDEDTKDMIHEGSKDVTRRLYNPNRRPAIPGNKHKIKIDRTKMVYGEIEILSCTPQRWGDLTEEDAHREGFSSRARYREYFYATNGFITDDDLVWVIEFKPIWTSRIGIILK